ncbi:MAG TPA: acyl-CoA dehydrogenase family protein [Hyphomicrobiaceae bacterium]|nr:acyl-CoA dehydrogenase family protein [Hyphomicrobiaceae bacterium]
MPGSSRNPLLGEEHEMLRAQVRRFVETEVKPVAERWETDGFVPRPILRRAGELGFLGLRYPTEYGGSAMDPLASVILGEELGRSTFGGFAITILDHTDMAAVHILHSGSKAQKERWLPRVVDGSAWSAVAITEPDAGSDVKGIRTRARRDGDHWVIDGTKCFITNGVLADVYCVAVKTNPEGGSRSVSMLLVEKGTPGFRVARKFDKMGWRSSDMAELVFEGARVPAENVIGDEGRGFYALMQNFQNERLVLGAQAVGEMLAALELTLDYVTTRKAFGATLFEKQVVRNRLALLATKVEAARALVYTTAAAYGQGQDCTREVSMVKALCGELVNEVMYQCLQLHGGSGYMTGSVIERMARDARAHPLGGGATDVMLEEVAKRLVRT